MTPQPAEPVDETMTNESPTLRDLLEADARRLMADPHIARGWDGERERSTWLAQVDEALDAFNATDA